MLSKWSIGIMFLVVLTITFPLSLKAQTTVTSSMNWNTEEFQILVSKNIGAETKPSDHPQTLKALELELVPLALKELGRLVWNSRGTLNSLILQRPELLVSMESLAQSFTQQWSRLSKTRDSLQAAFSLHLNAENLYSFSVEPTNELNASPPIGWVPTPEDGWTGIVIYVPNETPVRGIGTMDAPAPALNPRILTDDLLVLGRSVGSAPQKFIYETLTNRSNAESLVGRRPYRTIARGLYGKLACDIILSKEDEKRILSSSSGRKALAEGRVVILLDSIKETP